MAVRAEAGPGPEPTEGSTTSGKTELGRDLSENTAAMADIDSKWERHASTESAEAVTEDDVTAPKSEFYDQDADRPKTPDERAEAIVTKMNRGPVKDITAEAVDAEAPVVDEQEQRREQARKRIDDVDLAHGMAKIEDKGHNEATKLKSELGATAADVREQYGPLAAEARAQAAISRSEGNETEAKAAEARADKIEADMAMKVAALEADTSPDEAIKAAQAKAESYKKGADKRHQDKIKDTYVEDPDIAYAQAMAEKQPYEQIKALEKSAEGKTMTKREQEDHETLVKVLESKVETGGKAAAKDENERLEGVRDEISQRVVSASEKIHEMLASTKADAIEPIGVNDKYNPAQVDKLSHTLQESLQVDFSKEPTKSVLRGPRLFGQKFVDIYRQSEDRTYNGVVFVERRDRKTGQIVRLDVVSAPGRPEWKSEDELAKESLIERRRRRIDERKWQKAVEEELSSAQMIHGGLSSAEDPFVPGDAKTSNKKVPGSNGAKATYAGMLEQAGMDKAGSGSARKPKRRGFWYSLFGLN